MRKKHPLVALLAALVLAISVAAPASAKLPGKKTWRADVRAVMAGSSDYVDARVAKKTKTEKLAVNLDIDNTSIQTKYAYPKAVKPVLRFTQHAHDEGVTILFNTGRYDDQLAGIRKALTRAGYTYADVCGRQHGEGLKKSKQRCRQEYVDAGYTIIANVGNRSTDFVGDNYEKAYVLPSYDNKLS